MVATHVVIPYAARSLQLEIHQGMDTHRFGAVVCHRRFGKTVCAVNHLLKAAALCRRPRPRFAYIAPTYTQGKSIAWDYMKYYARPIPGQTSHESELRVGLPNEGQVRIFGADNPESLKGLYFDGVVFDEYGLQTRNIFTEVVRPMLADREGWALFMGTPNGKNQFYDIIYGDRDFVGAMRDPKWFYACYKASETGILPAHELASARSMMTQDEYDQEFECSFEASVKGSIFGAELRKARDEGRITRVPYDPRLAVDTNWDLGIGDSTSIWFSQSVPGTGEVRLIDYHEASGEGLAYYRSVLNERTQKYGYAYGVHWAPHDIEVKELGNGRSRLETAGDLGIFFQIVPKGSLEDGIHAARMLFAKCWFDETKCKHGLEALQAYHWDYNTRIKEFKPVPVHDWASHGADAFRYLATRHDDPRLRRPTAVRAFDPAEKRHADMLVEQYGVRPKPRTRGGMGRGGY